MCARGRYGVFQITLSRTYNASDLLTDIKELYVKAGSKGEGVTFILTDNEIKSEGFLEYINNMLATGEIGGLIPRDELDEILNGLIPVMKAQYPRRAPTNEALYEYFIERVKEKLHTVLCFSPVSEKFRQRALKFPAVFSGCTMDWYMAWPKDALVAVAHHSLGKFEISCTPEVKSAVVSTMGVVQDLVGKSCEDYFEQYVKPFSKIHFKTNLPFIWSHNYYESESSPYNNHRTGTVDARTSRQRRTCRSSTATVTCTAARRRRLTCWPTR